jgi:hypothetical protein
VYDYANFVGRTNQQERQSKTYSIFWVGFFMTRLKIRTTKLKNFIFIELFQEIGENKIFSEISLD